MHTTLHVLPFRDPVNDAYMSDEKLSIVESLLSLKKTPTKQGKVKNDFIMFQYTACKCVYEGVCI